ncbi:MAG: class I SAM-dependent methyltransferase, partial [Candidatus Eisenbacteria bacterium]
MPRAARRRNGRGREPRDRATGRSRGGGRGRVPAPIGRAVTRGAILAAKPERAARQAPLFLYELIDAAPGGANVLDAGCGPGSWPYARRPDLGVTGCDIKFPPGPPAPAANVRIIRGDLARLPLRDATFDLTVCHYVLEHVTELGACCDELARVTKPGGTLYLSVPRSAAFDDRL